MHFRLLAILGILLPSESDFSRSCTRALQTFFNISFLNTMFIGYCDLLLISTFLVAHPRDILLGSLVISPVSNYRGPDSRGLWL